MLIGSLIIIAFASHLFALFFHKLFRPPLTLQRLCELILDGPRWHQNPRKLLRAIDKTLHISPTFSEEDFEKEAQKEHSYVKLRLVPSPSLPSDPVSFNFDDAFNPTTVFPSAPIGASGSHSQQENTETDMPQPVLIPMPDEENDDKQKID